MGDLQPWPPLLDGTDAIGDDGGGGGSTEDGINTVDIDRGGGGGFPVEMEVNHPPTVQPPQAPNPLPSAIADENWQRAEEATREVLRCILPTVASEQRRKAVTEYVQKVLKARIEVYPFGSVPLKTYLPDGDIDLTAVGLPNTEDILAKDVYSFLEVEEHNKCSEFEVKDVQFIHAEADQYIGKDNLFKRSIVLIKAWCYYESRILGAHHGLISTYALETLVLYIFHLFHNSLNDPLVVLYRFLDFYSKFDWDNYCVSLYGPVFVSSLPDLIVEPPETDGSDLLFSKDFIKECADIFSVPSRGLDTNPRVFPQKHLNIVDPLKQNNNLGRSVSKGNFYRIRSAFTYGARKLGRILLLPVESIPDEVSLFFTNTLHRHGTRERPDVQDARPSCSDNGTTNHIRVNSLPSHLQVENGYDMMSISDLAISDVNGASTEETNGVNISDIQKVHETRLNKNPLNPYIDVSNGSCLPNDVKLEPNRIIEREIVSDARLSDDAMNLASTRASTPRIMGETVKTSGKKIHAPHCFFQAENSSGDENIDNRNSRDDTSKNAVLNRTGAVADEPRYETVPSSSTSWFVNDTVLSPTSNIHLSPSSSCMSEDSNFVDSLNDAKENIKGATSQNLADLSGNHHFHFMNLMYAQNSQETIINPYYNIQPLSPSHYQSKHPWNSFHQRNIYSHVGTNVLLPGNSFSPNGPYLSNKPTLLVAYGTKDIQTTRGTGTYFPNTNSRSYRERQQTGQGKNQMLGNNLQRTRYYSRNETLQDRGFVDEGNGEQSPRPQTSSFGGSGHVKSAPLEFANSRYPPFKGVPHGNGFAYPPDGKLEFGMLGAIAIGVSSPEQSDISEQGSSINQDSGSKIMPSTLQKPSTSFNHERPAQPYQLKDEEDFPPLTG